MTDETSEARYDLPAQPKETCPIIDKGLEALEDLRVYEGPDRCMMRRMDWCKDMDELHDWIKDLISEIDDAKDVDKSDVENALEKCRQQAMDLREWGQAWKDLAKENLDKVEAIETPWDGILLWWHEVGEGIWRATWLYRTCVLERHYARLRDAKIPVV